MLSSYVFPNRVDLPAVVGGEMGDGDDDALLVEASIGAESQSQS
jgi:hypothetical protein